jgi:catalase
MFDEAEIAAYDETRGQCMPINDPKTPFHEENSDEEMGNDVLEEEGQIDPEVKQHLDEAERNKQANAAINSGVRR